MRLFEKITSKNHWALLETAIKRCIFYWRKCIFYCWFTNWSGASFIYSSASFVVNLPTGQVHLLFHVHLLGIGVNFPTASFIPCESIIRYLRVSNNISNLPEIEVINFLKAIKLQKRRTLFLNIFRKFNNHFFCSMGLFFKILMTPLRVTY